MKTFSIITTEKSINIRMPNIVFWLFKKYAQISSVYHSPEMNGRSFKYVVFDEYSSEGKEVPPNEYSANPK